MNPGKNGMGESFEKYLRPLTFGVLTIGIGVSLALGPSTQVQDAEVLARRIGSRASDIQFRGIVFQLLPFNNLSAGEERESARQLIRFEMELMEKNPALQGPGVEVQRRMVLDYTGERIADLSRESLGPYRDSFLALYERGKLPDEKDPLLALPASSLALLKYYRATDPARHEALLAALNAEAMKANAFALGTMGLFLFLTVLSGGLIWRFMRRRPPSYLARFLETLSPQRRSALFESAILYIFLLFPAGNVLLRLSPDAWKQWMPMGLSLMAAAVSVWYFLSEAGGTTFRQTLWIPVMLGPPAAEGPSAAGEAPAPGPSEDAPVPAQVVLHSRPFPLIREVLIGLSMTLVVSPLLFMRISSSILFGDTGLVFPFAAPEWVQGDFAVVAFFAVVAIPVIEELVFRNWLYASLRFRFPLLSAALLSGLLFAVLHPHGWWPYYLILGTGLSFLREFRPGLLAPVVAHASMNAIVLVAVHAASGLPLP